MSLLPFFAIVAASAAGPQTATSVIVMGNDIPRAVRCYRDAKMQLNDADARANCSAALEWEALSTRDRAATLTNRGIMAARSGALESAIGDYDAALALTPDLPQALTSKAIASLDAQGDPVAAIALLDRALARSQADAWFAHFARGYAHEKAGHVREAYADYCRSVALRPDWAKSQEALRRFRVKPRA